MPEKCKNAELDAKNKKHSLYLDDFDNIKVWKQICEMFDVPPDTDQIYFDAENISYC